MEMKNFSKFISSCDFEFVVVFLERKKEQFDNVDSMYEQLILDFECFEVSSYFNQNTSYLEAVNDFFNDQ